MALVVDSTALCLVGFRRGLYERTPERDKEAVRHERAIRSLHDRTGAPLPEVRRLFAHEFSRLELGAKVRSYLSVLTVSNVRAMLRRKGA
jgi:hypothetical protein